MNLREYRALSQLEQSKIIEKIKYKYLNELKNHECIAHEMNIVQTAIRKIIEENNIKRTKEQIVLARKKYNLEKYGDENYCNSEKIKESLNKNDFNYGMNAQLKIAERTLKEQGLYSWILLTDNQKEYLKNEIIRLLNEVRYDEEIYEELKLTKGCYNRIKKEYKIKRDNELHQKIIVRRLNDKYGVDNIYQLNTVKEKIKQTNLEKYGVEYSWQREDVKKQIKQTKLERYGDENYRNDEKIKQTCIEKYGTESPYASNEIKEKIKQTNLERYGSVSPFGNKNIFKKGEETKIKRYGNKTYNNSEKGKQTKIQKYGSLQNIEKINQTCQEKYGIAWPCQLPQCVNKSNSISKINLKFAKLLISLNIEFEQEFVLNDKKYDFKIENILVELNPTYTHNSTKGCGFNGHYENPLNKNYHLEKYMIAKENGFRCIHIWDWDDVCKVINLLLPKQKIYARKLELREVSKKECDKFLNLYHLQNTCRGQMVRYGLYKDNQLIQIMTFGKPRYNKNYEWELLRLCTHKDYKIVGGSERLWKHFLREQNPKNVISYCDNSKFSGEVYGHLGMKLKEAQQPSCNWSKGKQRITQNLLNQRGADRLIGTNYGKGTSNRDIMIENKWLEVYDCGQNVWIYQYETSH